MPHSLHRTGRVLTRRDADGSDAGTEGIVIDRRELTVEDARKLDGEARRTLAAHGFEQREADLANAGIDFLQHDQVVGDYYAECAQIVKDTTGAANVAAFDHNVRSASGKQSERQIEGGQQVQAPGHFVHGDYTLFSGPQRLRDLACPPSHNDTLRGFLPEGRSLLEGVRVERALGRDGRFAIINVWRSIGDEPVACHPLALCDARTVDLQDLVVFEIHYRDRVGENYFARHAPRQRWYYYPGLTRREVLLIKQWDSAGLLARTDGARADASESAGPCTFSFHSAFEDPETPPDAPDRWSIEVRCAVLYG